MNKKKKKICDKEEIYKKTNKFVKKKIKYVTKDEFENGNKFAMKN